MIVTELTLSKLVCIKYLMQIISASNLTQISATNLTQIYESNLTQISHSYNLLSWRKTSHYQKVNVAWFTISATTANV